MSISYLVRVLFRITGTLYMLRITAWHHALTDMLQCRDVHAPTRVAMAPNPCYPQLFKKFPIGTISLDDGASRL